MIGALQEVTVVARPRVVVDVGSATGEFTGLLAGVLTDGSVIGYDLSPTAVERAQSRFGGAHFRAGSFVDAAHDHPGRVDLVTCLEVLYYVAADQRASAIDAVRAMLRPGGLVLASSMIGGSPYMDGAGLARLFEDGFHIERSGVLSLWPLTAFEKIRMKLGGGRATGRQAREYLPGGAGYQRLDRHTRLLRRLFGARTDSHAYVIARRNRSPS
jgi:SAM-dependent methyltransferase